MYAESAELLEWLWDMDRDDIFIYWGHAATASDLVVPPGGTYKIMQTCDGLCGYRSGLLWRFDKRSVSELAAYMTYEGKGHAPGIVIVGGCGSFLRSVEKHVSGQGHEAACWLQPDDKRCQGWDLLVTFPKGLFPRR